MYVITWYCYITLSDWQSDKIEVAACIIVNVDCVTYISNLLYTDFRDTAAVYEFYSLHPRRVVYPTFANND